MLTTGTDPQPVWLGTYTASGNQLSAVTVAATVELEPHCVWLGTGNQLTAVTAAVAAAVEIVENCVWQAAATALHSIALAA